MADTAALEERHLAKQGLGPDTTAILSAVAKSLEGRWRDEGSGGYRSAERDDAVVQQILKLRQYNQVFKGKEPGLVQFSRPNAQCVTRRPIYIVALKIESGICSISTIALDHGLVRASDETVQLGVGDIVYITKSVLIASPLDALLLR